MSLSARLLAAGWAASVLLLPCGCEPAATPANFLVLVADDVGTDSIGVYAERPDPPRTPHIDGLAARGVLFRNAYAPPSCSPSRAALLTGRHPRRYGIGSSMRRHVLPLRELTLPELLRTRGYDSSAVGKWHLAPPWTEEGLRHPLDSGFAWYAGSPGNLRASKVSRDAGYFRWKKNTNGVVSWSTRYATSETVDDSIARIQAMREPWLLWVAFNAAHFPLHEPPAHLHGVGNTGTAPDAFRAMMEALDSEIGRLLDAMDPAVATRTTVIFVSDNGSPKLALAPEADEDRFKRTLYEGGINVPLIVSGPAVRQPGSESAALVHVVDVLPTLAEIAGVDTSGLTRDDGRPLVLDGRSFLAQLRDPAAPSRHRTVFQDRFAPNGRGPFDEDERSLRDARYKLVQTADGHEELFDLEARHDDGPDLMGDLTPERRAARTRLHREMARIVAELDADRLATLPESARRARRTARAAARAEGGDERGRAGD